MSSSRCLVTTAADRNKGPILEVLKKVIPQKLSIFGPDHCKQFNALEVASGTGQHVVHFAEHFPTIHWQPSDIDQRHIESIQSYISSNGNGISNIKPPFVLDIMQPISDWSIKYKEKSLDLILSINLVHISPYSCTEGLFRVAGKLLDDHGIMVTYGPYAEHGNIFPESNVNFDAGLKASNPEWGLRDIEDLKKEAEKNGLTLDAMFDMPSNNKTLVWARN